MSDLPAEELARIARLDKLIELFTDFLRQVEVGKPPNLERFERVRASTLRSLERLGPPPTDGLAAPQIEVRLLRLIELHEKVTTVTLALHGEVAGRLKKLTSGRQGLAGYQRALAGFKRVGPKRGEG